MLRKFSFSFLIILLGATLSGCSSRDSYSNNDNSSAVSGSSYYGNNGNDEEVEPINPYNNGSGHSAGFEWAQENDPGDCGGNSQSFIEGCEEYYSQLEGN